MDAIEKDFETQRKENIKKNEEEFKKLFPEACLFPRKRERNAAKLSTRIEKGYSPPFPKQFLPRRKTLSRNCKSSWKRQPEETLTDDTFDDEELEKNNKHHGDYNRTMIVKFPGWSKRFKSETTAELTPYDEEDFDIERSPKRRKIVVYRPIDAVAEEDLILVAERTSEKQYDQVDGTSCHQCRQKTSDLKTVCRSGRCYGVRGQFCGPCLKNRYGECAKVAIMDPDWVCPPCRGICNCSFCMKKRGRHATGILIHHAKQSGYDDVSSFLGLTEKVIE